MKILGLPVIDGITFIIYILAIVAIGVWSSKKVHNSTDFSSAGQSLTYPLVVGSVMASFFGGYTGAGGPEFVYNAGLTGFTVVLGYSIGLILQACMAKRLRRSGAKSFPEFMAITFDEKARSASAFFTILMLMGTAAGQFVAAGTIASLLGICSFQTGIVFGGILIFLLTVTGGLHGVALTDTIQQVFITVIVAIAVPVTAFHDAGGVSYVFEHTDPAKLSFIHSMPLPALLSGFAANMFSYIAEPAYAQRIFAAKDEKTAFRGAMTGHVATVIFMTPVFMSVFCLPFLFPDIEMPSQFVATCIMTYMPPVLKGLGVAVFFSLLLTTGDTFLLTTSSVMTTDIWPKIRKKASDHEILIVGRATVAVITVFSIIVALWFQNIYNAMNFFFGPYGAAVTIPVILAVIMKDKISPRFVWLGIWAAGIVCLIYDAVSGTRNGVWIGIVINLVICLAGSVGQKNKAEALPEKE